MRIPVQKGKPVTGNIVVKKTDKILQSRRPKTGMKYLRLLHNKGACIKSTHCGRVFGGGKGYSSTTHPIFPDLAPCYFFLFPKLKFHLFEKR